MTLDKSLDPIGFSIIWGRLVSIVDEAALTLGRTAFSPLITESNDFGVVLLDTDGYAVAQSSFSIPPFLGTIPEAVRSILKKFPQETWVEGDAALTNDPWYAGGHLLDITLLTPIFYEGRLVAFTGSTAHWADIGGTGFSTDTNDLFEEGLLIPPSKLYRGGHVEQDLLDLILQNTRVPDKVFGDLNAQIDAGTVCERRLGDLLREHDLSDLGTLAASIHDVGEQAMRRRIAELPDGRYCHEINIDGLGYAITISAAIDVKGDEMEIDLAGTTSQLPGAVNCPPGYTKALLFHALKCVLDPTTPNNDGCHRPITVHAPVGTVVNPRPPAAVNGRHLVGHMMSRVVYGALKHVLPEHVIADCGSMPTVAAKFNSVAASQHPFSFIFMANGGMGARAAKDGLACAPFPTNPSCGSVEIMETDVPLRVLRKEISADSGGAGRFRGGLGQEVEIEITGTEPVVLSLFLGGAVSPPHGFFGGGDGTCNTASLNGGGPLNAAERVRLQPGDRITLNYGGGGGQGAPEDRDPELVCDDLRKGFITARAAKEVYGLEASGVADGA